MTKIGLTLSLLCLILCILTFKFCRSIQGTRTTIHLHLCICLFVADLCFLAGISQTTPVVCLCTQIIINYDQSYLCIFTPFISSYICDRVAAGLLQRCSICSSRVSLPGCCWKECSCTVWWSKCSTPPFGPSTYTSLVMGYLLLSSLYLPVLDQMDMALTDSKCCSMCASLPDV